MKNTTAYWWWLRRRTGGRAFHRNPLCRRSDRLQQLSAWAWFLIAALTVPLVGIAIAPAIADSWRAPQMRPVTAVVEHVAADPAIAGPSAAREARPTHAVRVRWITGSGVVRRGTVTAYDPPREGTQIRVWVTRSGSQVAANPPHDTRVLDIVMLTINAAVDVCLAGYGAHRLLRWRLDRRRLRAWDTELNQLLTQH